MATCIINRKSHKQRENTSSTQSPISVSLSVSEFYTEMLVAYAIRLFGAYLPPRPNSSAVYGQLMRRSHSGHDTQHARYVADLSSAPCRAAG